MVIAIIPICIIATGYLMLKAFEIGLKQSKLSENKIISEEEKEEAENPKNSKGYVDLTKELIDEWTNGPTIGGE